MKKGGEQNNRSINAELVKIWYLGLKIWLSSKEYLLLFNRTRAQFPAPKSGRSQLPVTMAPKKSNTVFWLPREAYAHTGI